MNDMATTMPDPLVFTESAANKVKSLIEEEGNNDLKLRVFVTGGGCSGLQYGFTFDEAVNEDDTVMQKNGVSLLIDPMSYQYLVGAEIGLVDHRRRAEFLLQRRDPRLEHRLLVLGVVVLGVLRDVAELARLLDPGGDLAPAAGGQLIEFCLQVREAFRGEDDVLGHR